jgi:hypothetical protein
VCENKDSEKFEIMKGESMALDLKKILLEFSGPPDDILGDYIRHIANGGLFSMGIRRGSRFTPMSLI